ncbi:hypothetical protein LX36DRAFT_659214 [Colletotrichum falcatum]|nr:hypothetical protein LX36DRAFT_659214 [Colletotrichum falcatum]
MSQQPGPISHILHPTFQCQAVTTNGTCWSRPANKWNHNVNNKNNNNNNNNRKKKEKTTR